MYVDRQLQGGDATIGKSKPSASHGRRSAKDSTEPLPQYSDAQLYNQLLYLASLFDVEKAVEVSKGTPRAGMLAKR